jgi:hypothetical protein
VTKWLRRKVKRTGKCRTCSDITWARGDRLSPVFLSPPTGRPRRPHSAVGGVAQADERPSPRTRVGPVTPQSHGVLNEAGIRLGELPAAAPSQLRRWRAVRDERGGLERGPGCSPIARSRMAFVSTASPRARTPTAPRVDGTPLPARTPPQTSPLARSRTLQINYPNPPSPLLAISKSDSPRSSRFGTQCAAHCAAKLRIDVSLVPAYTLLPRVLNCVLQPVGVTG